MTSPLTKSSAIRQAFFDYFQNQGHTLVPSSSLVPSNDPTLLFTNAGMVQFKDVFLGNEKRSYSRAASSQRCVRAGGKHNDLENVGYTARHHTFFEMLGNFSFGDYFKREAITYAWEFLTQTLQLPPERLWVTVHVSDDEAANIWLQEIGVSPERFSRLDEDNFWQMGDTGPCGPSSEIFYDHGPEVPGGPPGKEGDDLDRYIEIWNLVFMQYERDAAGAMTPLPKPSIDTGMGLERIAAVMQGVHSNYEIDLFANLIKAAAKLTGTRNLEDISLRVIADHIRSCAFLVVDGVLPSNEGRGYVLRRIMRRALRHGYKLGATEPFFHKLVPALAQEMGEAYPELAAKQAQVEKALLAEEQQFAKTLGNGMGVLEDALQSLDDKTLPGAVIFKLYDTYGFPVDLTNDIARERGYRLDMAGYDACMAQQKNRARAASRFELDYTGKLDILGETLFTGYDSMATETLIKAIYVDGEPVETLATGEQAILVLEQTPFYAESGGQVGDRGVIEALNNKASGRGDAVFDVQDCRKQGANHLHSGHLTQGSLRVGAPVKAQVNESTRRATARNHSATHLLHAALRRVLGEQVTQQGSLVNAERLRFDFSHPQAMTAVQIREVEHLVNAEILRNTRVETDIMSMDAARQKGAMALFGEKYGDDVRVLTMGDGFSVELCGGTHVSRTGDIGLLRIVSESGIAAGVRRVEAVTGSGALALFDDLQDSLNGVAESLKTDRSGVVQKICQLQEQNRRLQKELDALKMKLAGAAGGDILGDARDIQGIKVLAKQIEGADSKTLRQLVDQFKSRADQAVVLLAGVQDGKVALVAGVSKPLCEQISAGQLMQLVSPLVDGKGGGRPDMAQGGGTNPDGLQAALDRAYAWVEQKISNF